MIKLIQKEIIKLKHQDGTPFEVIECEKPEEIPEFDGRTPCKEFGIKILHQIVELDGRQVLVTGVAWTYGAFDYVGSLLITIEEMT